MATKFATTLPHAPQPSVRPGRLRPMAGRAIAAVTKAIAALPPETAAHAPATVLSSDVVVADVLSAAAELSPDVWRAFLEWLAISIEYETTTRNDAEDEIAFGECLLARHVLVRTATKTEADLWLMVYLSELDSLTDSSLIGPLTYEHDAENDDLTSRRLSNNIIMSLPAHFSLAEPLAALSARVSVRDGTAAALFAAEVAAVEPSALQVWSKAVARMEIAQRAVDRLTGNSTEPDFGKVSSVLWNAQIALLTTPAPTLADLAYKQKLFFRIDAHEFDTPAIAASITADIDRLINAVESPSDMSWERGVEELRAAKAAYTILNPTDEVTDAIADKELQAGKAILAPPAETIAHAVVKLRTIIDLFDHERDENLVGVLSDFERLCAVEAMPIQENPALIAAFEQYRNAFRVMKDDTEGTISKAEEDRLLALMDPADCTLHAERAVTPAGVAMKLKRAFVGLTGEGWSDFAVFDDRPAAFAEGLRMEGMYVEMLWRAIEDLERMTGAPDQVAA